MPFEIEMPTTFNGGAFKIAVKEALDNYIEYTKWHGFFQPAENAPIIALIKDLSLGIWWWESDVIATLKEIDEQRDSSLTSSVREALFRYINQHIFQSTSVITNQQIKELSTLLFSLEKQQVIELLHKQCSFEDNPLIYSLLKHEHKSVLPFIDQCDDTENQALFNIPLEFMFNKITCDDSLENQHSTSSKMNTHSIRLVQAVIRYNPSLLSDEAETEHSNLLMHIAIARSESFREIFEQMKPETQRIALKTTSANRFNLLSAAIQSNNKSLARYMLHQYERILGKDVIKMMLLNTDKYNLIEIAIMFQPDILNLMLKYLDPSEKTHIFNEAIYQGDNYLIIAAGSMHSSLAVLLFLQHTNREQQRVALSYIAETNGNHALLKSARSSLFYSTSASYQACAIEGFNCILNLMVSLLPKEEQAKYLAQMNVHQSTILSCLMNLAASGRKMINNSVFAHLEVVISNLTDQEQAAIWKPLMNKYGSGVVQKHFADVMGYTPASLLNARAEPTKTALSPVGNVYRFHQLVASGSSDSTNVEPSQSPSAR